MFEGDYTTIGTDQTLHPRVIKNQLNHYLCMQGSIDWELALILLRSSFTRG